MQRHNNENSTHCQAFKIYKLTRLKLIDNVNQSSLWKYSNKQFIMGDIEKVKFSLPFFPLRSRSPPKTFFVYFFSFLCLLFFQAITTALWILCQTVYRLQIQLFIPCSLSCVVEIVWSMLHVSHYYAFHATLYNSKGMIVHRGRLSSTAPALQRPRYCNNFCLFFCE